MFTGIIETVGEVTSISINGTNKTFHINSPVSEELKVDQSVSHDGVCLTVEAVNGNQHRVTAIKETLDKSDLGFVEGGEPRKYRTLYVNEWPSRWPYCTGAMLMPLLPV